MVKLFFLVILSLTHFSVLASDPTRPPTGSGVYSKSYQHSAVPVQKKLTAIFIMGDHRVAVINHRKYQVGDQMNNHLILRIDGHRVLLQSDKGNYYLTLVPKVKQTK